MAKVKDGYNQILKEFSDGLSSLVDHPAKVNMLVMLLHDVTGVKKRDIKLILKHGPELHKIYSMEQDFKVNKNPKAKLKKKSETVS